MPKINDDIVRAVTDAARIEDIVGDFVDLRKAGVNMTGICPFHDDQHDGNFIVRPSTLSLGAPGRNTYKCFVCEKKGGPVQFLMEAERMTFPDAIRYIGKKYNIPVDDTPIDWTPPPPRPTPPPLPVMEMDRRLVKETIEKRNTEGDHREAQHVVPSGTLGIALEREPTTRTDQRPVALLPGRMDRRTGLLLADRP